MTKLLFESKAHGIPLYNYRFNITLLISIMKSVLFKCNAKKIVHNFHKFMEILHDGLFDIPCLLAYIIL